MRKKNPNSAVVDNRIKKKTRKYKLRQRGDKLRQTVGHESTKW